MEMANVLFPHCFDKTLEEAVPSSGVFLYTSRLWVKQKMFVIIISGRKIWDNPCILKNIWIFFCDLFCIIGKICIFAVENMFETTFFLIELV